MPRWRAFAGGALLGVVLAFPLVALTGALAWNRATARARASIGGQEGAPPALPAVYDTAELAGLPAPVARYFRLALTPGQPLVRHARFVQDGSFARERDRWAPFTAVEDFQVGPPGFVWDATIDVMPFVPARVRDSYVAGEGRMHAAASALVTVVDRHGTREMAEGALLRYLSEAVWLPTALLPSAGVRWSAIDGTAARATLSDHGVTVSMIVRFGPGGEIACIDAMRYRDVDGVPVLTRWNAQFERYRRVAGMLVPGWSQAGWLLPDGEGFYPYWRGRNVASEYRYAGAAAATVRVP